MKKAVITVTFFHALCYISMIAGHFLKSSKIMGTAFIGDIIGSVVCPMVLAAAAMAIALSREKRVLKMYPSAASAIGAVGLARGILFFFVQGAAGFIGAMRYLVLSFLILTLWFIIFELSSGMLNKGTKFNRRKK